MQNLAFIDGQNLHMGTKENNWKIDHRKFRIYIKDKYKVSKAYYFIGYYSDKFIKIYDSLKEAGFLVYFKDHHPELLAKKKGNIDTDLVFEVMRQISDMVEFDKIVIVSGDGKYKKMIDYLINKKKFSKILFPTRRSSTLYKHLGSEYFDYLDNIRNYIAHKNKKSS